MSIIVTGAAGGIGRAITVALARSGNAVIAADLSQDAVDNVAEAIQSDGGTALGVPLDVTDPQSRQGVIDACADQFGRIDAVVNCAGVLRDARAHNLDPEMMAWLLEVNLTGPLDLARRALPHLKHRGGSIVNIASRAWLGTYGSTAYSAAKGGLVGASRSLALELGPHGITVNCVAPGFIETAMTTQLPDAVRERSIAAIPVGRPGHPDDVARVVRYLVEDAPYTTGQVLVVCGGRSIGMPMVAAS
ncbi:short-chain dehydrogenase/reductase SDR (plasmid) [Rhodococcus opacus]|uniref:Short-chain dehydrogenase/reductase SDR n=1 Tax=Rhodococcus opacus TaxID=37919 RepID=A0A1B1KI46_RHOOP|nr:SDR family NAD(P)-dependent oxidoreductase [Rhodococcus opacus]ANS32230.1 short-chain dehydrogenase/reductase SDR [Rhodococcus opacus]